MEASRDDSGRLSAASGWAVVQGCAASGVSLCGKEGRGVLWCQSGRWRVLGSHQLHWYVLTGSTGRKLVMQDREPGSTESPGSAVLSLLVPGDNSPVPFLLRGCSPKGSKILPLSALWFSQSSVTVADLCSSAEAL